VEQGASSEESVVAFATLSGSLCGRLASAERVSRPLATPRLAALDGGVAQTHVLVRVPPASELWLPRVNASVPTEPRLCTERTRALI
jgi:hypothetical protein